MHLIVNMNDTAANDLKQILTNVVNDPSEDKGRQITARLLIFHMDESEKNGTPISINGESFRLQPRYSPP